MSHVFISYNKQNKDYARHLADYLLDHGFDVWIDDRIDYGDNWLRVMVNAVRECAAFVVVMTPESEASRWVELEVAWAHRWEKPMFPVLRGGENWPVFELTQYADVQDGSLPDNRFLHELSEYAPSKKMHGQNITPQAQPERLARPIEAATPPPDLEEESFDVYAAITDFFRLRDEQHWSKARMVLMQIERAEQTPNWFDTTQYAQELQTAIEHEKVERHRQEWEAAAEREYSIIRVLAQHESPERVWEALQAFWQSYEDYDPDNLADKFRPASVISQGVQRLLDIMLNPSVPPPQRAEAGRKLAEVGDPRPGVGLRADGLPDIDWVEIPAGEFVYQDNERLTLPKFYIARYPITYKQFQAFIDAEDGFHDSRWWSELAADEQHRHAPVEQASKFWNHPRERVSWWDAVTFCRWLSVKLGYEVRLPTEQEWEKAARGTAGREYPYGNKFDASKGNTAETGIGQTSAVGIFPHGVSPYSVSDMSGNIFEWCLNEFYNLKKVGHGGTAVRGLRGGSWLYYWIDARTIQRSGSEPFARDDDNGFRVVCSHPMP